MRTPEVFLLDPSHVVRYWGQIDDQFGVGFVRTKPTRRFLQDALEDILASRAVGTPVVEPVGCRIGRVNRRTPTGNVTYSNQIARILQARCVTCHRAGEIAPFVLTSYSDAVAWAENIREVIETRRMPPWLADPHYGKFQNDARITDEEKRLVSAWIDNGEPEGDPAQLPPKLKFADGWQIPKPDLIIKMPKPFTVPAQGTVEYQYFTVDPGFKEDVWIRGAEGRPGNRSVVHHLILFYLPPWQKHARPVDPLFNAIGSFAPGIPALVEPTGRKARRIPAGSKLMFQMHYTPNGTEQVDQSEVGLVFADRKTVKRELSVGGIFKWRFQIPPGADDYRVEAKRRFDEDTYIDALVPHMHLRGKSFRFTAIYPDGRKEIMLDVPRYDFNWQNVYGLSEPKLLPAGSQILCQATYDNSERNLANPDPTQSVHWGDQTWDEMMVGSYYYSSPEQDMSLGPPKTTSAGHGVYDVAFRYRPTTRAKSVDLAGTFNDWKPTGHSMSGPDHDGWYQTTLRLPEGRHEYKFVVDGKTWKNDPGNSLQTGAENNSVITLGSPGPPRVSRRDGGAYDVAFRYRPIGPAHEVYLAGSFNHWKPTSHKMAGPDGDGWYTSTLKLDAGKYEYKFVVDGKLWKDDPANPAQSSPNRNSVLWVRN